MSVSLILKDRVFRFATGSDNLLSQNGRSNGNFQCHRWPGSRFINKVFCGDSIRLLRLLPSKSIHAIITDPMYGCGFGNYEWGRDPNFGNPTKHWCYHEPYYKECLRVLVPGGKLAWAQSSKYVEYFSEWFGEHRKVGLIWTRGRTRTFATLFVVQTREQQAVPFPDRDNIIVCKPFPKTHPSSKPVEMMAWLIEELTASGDIILDPFCGIGGTLIASKQLGRHFIGCDISRTYCRITLHRLKSVADECRM